MTFLPLAGTLLGLVLPPTAVGSPPVPLAERGAVPPADVGAPRAMAPAAPRAPRVVAQTARLAPWCGTERTSDDATHEVGNGTYKFHAVYVIAADARSRLRSVAPQLQSDLFDASALLERLYGRALRLDMGTNCGPRNVDITLVRLRQTTAQLAAAVHAGAALDVVMAGLEAAGLPVAAQGTPDARTQALTRNWVVWLDGPSPADTCGQATMYDDPTRSQDNWNQLAGKVALIFRDGAGFCSARAVRHEMSHTLGAVVSSAPHSEQGGHCTDAFEDTMCTADAPVVASGDFGQRFFDYGNDDYWDPPGGAQLGWWTVDLSRFVCPDARCNGARPVARRRAARAARRARAAARRRAS
jgi:hypothetical protein